MGLQLSTLSGTLVRQALAQLRLRGQPGVQDTPSVFSRFPEPLRIGILFQSRVWKVFNFVQTESAWSYNFFVESES